MHIGFLTLLEPEGSHYIKILLTFDIPFIFYDHDRAAVADVDATTLKYRRSDPGTLTSQR